MLAQNNWIYLVIKSNEVMIHATILMNFKNILRRKTNSHTCMYTLKHISWIHLYEMARMDKYVETGHKLVAFEEESIENNQTGKNGIG